MIANVVNAVAIIVGGCLGLLFKNKMSERLSDILVKALGLCVSTIGIKMAIDTDQTLIVIVCCAIGALIGEALKLETRLENCGDWIKRKFIKGESQGSFTEGFVTASMVFCVGSMAIVGPLQAGLQGNYDILFSKSLLDGIIVISFAASMGIGALFAAIPVFVYQGAITLLASLLVPVLSDSVINAMNAVGGVLILGIGLRMLGLKDIRVGNMVPAVFLPIAALPLIALF